MLTRGSYGSIAQWKLLYLILGALAVSNGLIVIFFLPDSPNTARFLSEEEKIAALERVRLDQAGTHNKKIKRYQIVEAFKDVRQWIMFVIILCVGIPNGGLSAFTNIITKSFGWTERQTLLLDMPRAPIGGFAVVAVGWLSDRLKDRMTLILIFTLPTLIGFAILTGMQNSGDKGVLEFAFLFQYVSSPCFPLCYAWNASNIGGHTKKNTVNGNTSSPTLVAFYLNDANYALSFHAFHFRRWLSCGDLHLLAFERSWICVRKGSCGCLDGR